MSWQWHNTLPMRPMPQMSRNLWAEKLFLYKNPCGIIILPEGEACRDPVVRYLLAGMNSTAQKAINYDKLREITQKPDENPSEFLKCPKETLRAFTKIDPASALGSSFLAMHFITQSAPDIRCKLKKAEDGPPDPSRRTGRYGI